MAPSISGKDLFDSSLWKDELKTSVFYTFMASLRRKVREEVKETSRTHQFIRQLRDQRKLVRCYTQNIDGLEAREGLCTDWNRDKGSKSRFTKKAMELPQTSAAASTGGALDGGCEVVQLHGDLDVLRCTICSARCSWEDGNSEAVFAAGKAPGCKMCIAQDRDRRQQGKRGMATGSLRPNVVLYGEEHPVADTLSAITTHDLRFGPDVLLILGTSLQVHGVKVMVKEFAKAVHRKTGKQGTVIFVNLAAPSESVWNDVIDYWVAMDCDEWVDNLRLLRPCLFETQTELAMKVVKKPDTKTVSQGKSKAGGVEEDKENRARGQSPELDPKQKVPKTVVPRPWLPDEAARMRKWWSENNMLKTPSKPTQLLTPPTSRPEARGRGRPRKTLVLNETQPTAQASPQQPRTPSSQRPKQSHQTSAYDEEDAILETPSKRRKTDIRIWEDDKTLGGGDDTVESVATNGSQQGLKGLDLAQSLSTSQAQMPGRENLAEERTTPRKKRKRV